MKKRRLTRQDTLQRYLLWGVCAIILLLPFHAFFTTWASTAFGHLLLLRAWKELLLVVLGVMGGILLVQNNLLRVAFFRDVVTRYAALFAVWVLAAALLLTNDPDAAALGAAIHLRGPFFFLLAVMAVFSRPVSEQYLIKLVTYPAVGVVAFGLLQLFVLPSDFLRHFGYQKNITIPPYFTIDEQQDKVRIISTLRGPNPLGVYLIAPILAAVSTIKIKITRNKNLVAICCLLLAALLVLYGSHSRSAWLGLAAGICVYGWYIAPKKVRSILLSGAVAGVLVLGGVAYANRDTAFVQDVILHDNPTEGGEVSSNGERLNAIERTVTDIQESPVVGCGAGCAGPASMHHEDGAKISENFFLQIIQELGVVGLVLFLLLFVSVLKKIYAIRTSFAYAWLGVAAGVSVASLLSHAWADDTIAYVWWGIAGLLTGSSPQEIRKEKE